MTDQRTTPTPTTMPTPSPTTTPTKAPATTKLTAGAKVFEDNAQDYDAWFDSDKGQTLFRLELDCLASAKQQLSGQWLEIGVGSGRFAQALGVEHGIDPAPEMVRLAQARGIDTVVGFGEDLPYPDAKFDGVMMVCTICFVQDADKVLKECQRVLKPGGHLLIGFVPLDSVWGQFHSLRGKAGHTYYADAAFFTQTDLEKLAALAGLRLKKVIGCELPAPKSLTNQSRNQPGNPSTDSGSTEHQLSTQPIAGVESFKAALWIKD